MSACDAPLEMCLRKIDASINPKECPWSPVVSLGPHADLRSGCVALSRHKGGCHDHHRHQHDQPPRRPAEIYGGGPAAVTAPAVPIRRSNEVLWKEGILMLEGAQSSDGVITKPSSKSVAQTIDRLSGFIADRGFTLFRVIDHSGTAERAGVKVPASKLVLFGKPAVGGKVMVAAPLGVGFSAQGAGLGGQQWSGIRELQLTGVLARAAPHRQFASCPIRRG
jgi:hypothetical protein